MISLQWADFCYPILQIVVGENVSKCIDELSRIYANIHTIGAAE